MRLRMLACLAALSLPSTAQEAVTFPKILEGSGWACKGRFSRTGKMLYWKTVSTSCRAPYTVVSHDGSDWLLQVKSGKTCGFDLIEMTANPEHSARASWTVAGLVGPSGADGNLSCTMYDVTAKAHGRRRVSR